MVGKAKKSLLSNHLLLPSAMRDFASCFSENAVKISDTSCSGSSSSGGGRSSLATTTESTTATSVLSVVASVYRVRLSTSKEVLVRVAWSRSHVGPALSVGVDDSLSLDAMNGQLLRKKKGTRSYLSGKSAVAVHWDISAAKFGSGPEPIDGFYVVVMVNAELGLWLGDMSRECIGKFEGAIPTAKFSMVSRKEQVLGHGLYSTRSRLGDTGREHEIAIGCKGEGWPDAKDSELSVWIDRKRVVWVRRLRWNFRGNQTVFVDGSPVDVLWDVHDWWFGGASGYAMFMFRRRSAQESRLWLEEETLHRDQAMSEFSLSIQTFKS